MIKFGSAQYFGLLEFRDQLNNRYNDRFDLVNLDKLRYEVNIKIEQINLLHKSQTKQVSRYMERLTVEE